MSKPPFKGELKVFRVGNHGESLLNIHKAVEAFSLKKKSPAKPPLINIDEEGRAKITPGKLTDNFRKVVMLMSQKGITELLIEDPFHHDFSAVFKASPQPETGVLMVSAEKLAIDGLALWLKDNGRLGVIVRKGRGPDQVKFAGHIEKAGILPIEMTFGVVASARHNDDFEEELPAPRTLKENEVTPGTIKSGKQIEEAIARLAQPTDYLNIVSLGLGKRGQPLGRLWRPDAPIKTTQDISPSHLFFTGNGYVAPKMIILKTSAGVIKKNYAIITGPGYEIGPAPALIIPYLGEPKP